MSFQGVLALLPQLNKDLSRKTWAFQNRESKPESYSLIRASKASFWPTELQCKSWLDVLPRAKACAGGGPCGPRGWLAEYHGQGRLSVSLHRARSSPALSERFLWACRVGAKLAIINCISPSKLLLLGISDSVLPCNCVWPLKRCLIDQEKYSCLTLWEGTAGVHGFFFQSVSHLVLKTPFWMPFCVEWISRSHGLYSLFMWHFIWTQWCCDLNQPFPQVALELLVS